MAGSTGFISNARMYGVSPVAEAAWRELIAHIAREAGTAFDYVPYPAPQPLEALWRRPDLGCVQMCGYPIVLAVADVVPLASPIPRASWAGGQAVYRTDLIVRDDAPHRELRETFGGTVGWTVEHSHSGFNALRHHLLDHLRDGRSRVYDRSVGHLVTAGRVLEAVLDGSIDVGPLDAYWHDLVRRYRPELARGVRVLESTATAPMPAFVAAPGLPESTVTDLRAAFSAASTRPWFARFGDALLIDGFEAVTRETFAATLAWDREAVAANYLVPG